MSYRSGMPLMLHSADLHVGDSRNLPGYLDRQETMLYQITKLCIEREVDLCVLVGDIFDAKHLKPREKDMFLRWIIEHDRAGKKHDFDTIAEAGNHDVVEDGYTHLRQHKIMQSFGMLTRTHIVEADPKLLGPFKGNIWVAALPACKYKGDEINFAISALHKQLEKKLDSKQISIPGTEGDVYFVAMVHEAIQGAENELGNWSVKKGPKLDPDLPVTYWALGDIHKPFQQILPNAWYPGSPIQHDFGDVETERGVLLVDLEEPTDPEPVMVKGVRPLLTLSEVPRKWPDAIVRFEGTPEEIADTEFPETVVGFKPVLEESHAKAAVTFEDDGLLTDLPEILADQGVPVDYQQDIIDEVQSAMGVL